MCLGVPSIKSRPEVTECLLSFGAESFVFQFAIQNVKIKMHRTIILPVVLYGCESWPVTLREERGMRVFENRVLRRIFGVKTDEVTREWRKLHNEELNDLYCSLSILSCSFGSTFLSLYVWLCVLYAFV